MSSQSITSTIKIFDGTKETFGLWSSRIRSKILAISTNASAALNGRGEFKGVNFKPDMEEEEILVTPGETTGSQLNVFETPCATASNLTSKFKSIETGDTVNFGVSCELAEANDITNLNFASALRGPGCCVTGPQPYDKTGAK